MIKAIRLKNFKCFDCEEIKLGAVSLLTGLNGMGKSSVIQSLLMLRQSRLDGLLPTVGLELNGSLIKLGTARDVFNMWAVDDTLGISLEWVSGANVDFRVEYHREADVLKLTNKSIDSNIFKLIPFNDDFHYQKAERLGPRVTNAMSDYQVIGHRQIGSDGEYVGHFLHAYGDEPVSDRILCHPSNGGLSLRHQVQKWLGDISPGTEIDIGFHPEMDIVNLQFSFVTGKQRSNKYRTTSVGFGLTYSLPVIVALLSSKPGGIVLIENPEAHLHPRGQFKMGELISRVASTGVQVIVESHSDHVLNGIRLAVYDSILEPEKVAISYFNRIEKDNRVQAIVESPIIDSNGRIDNWPEGFFDEWDASLSRLLTPKNER